VLYNVCRTYKIKQTTCTHILYIQHTYINVALMMELISSYIRIVVEVIGKGNSIYIDILHYDIEIQAIWMVYVTM